jgi:hypothetical protein
MHFSDRIDWEDVGGGVIRVARRWRYEDGFWSWRSNVRSTRLWTIIGPNSLPPAGKLNGRRACKSVERHFFDPRKRSITLEDFVYDWENGAYLHLTTRLSFKARQLNEVFFDKKFWPKCNGREVRPTIFIKRYSRVSTAMNLIEGFQGVDAWLNNMNS